MAHQLTAPFADLDDEEWLELLIRGGDPRTPSVELPRMPDPDIQRRSSATLGEDALREGLKVYRFIKDKAAQWNQPITSDTRLLDFGCGWGRVMRFFVKDLPSSNLFGVDIDAAAVASCSDAIPGAHVHHASPRPPIAFGSDTFDLIYAYSVFSHLPEQMHLEWVQELTRCLKPRGLLIASTQGRSFVETIRDFQGRDDLIDPWQKQLAAGFPEPDHALEDYDSGRYVYAGLPRPDYGHTLIPKQYVESMWTPFLAIREFVDDRAVLPQALIVAQKR